MAELLDGVEEACARELMLRPSAIQPYGLLTVVDRESDQITMAAGDFGGFLGKEIAAKGGALADLAGDSLESLIARSGEPLSHIPIYLTTLNGSPRGPLVLLAHILNS